MYTIKVFNWYIIWIKEDEYKSDSNATTSLSVIIPFKDEANNLPQLIDSLKAQTFNQWELILVNDHSTDDGVSIAKKLIDNSSIDTYIIDAKKNGKKAALHQGAQLARYPVIVTTDADCTFHANWLTTLSSFYTSQQVDLAIALVSIKRTKGLLNRFQQVDFAALQLSGAAAALQQKAIMCNGANLMCTKELYLQSQLQDHIASGDDMFLLEWIKAQSKTIRFIKTKHALVETEPTETINDFLQQRARWAAKAPRYKDKHIIATGLIVSALNMVILISLLTGLWFPLLLKVFGVSLLVKSIADYMLLKAGSRDFNFSITLFKVLFIQLLYPFYVFAVLLFPVFTTIKWKSRHI
ncbi:glycosyltransferase [Carboxylicivirga sp. A043]|uniref:glycosyltransferase n=1 Tax=Carboxylicivirga litoralis TaxID=2816963 RepID=UPI0021CB371B|nr:glycosyltransferase [Carboxylicivirga sp. A043]MCU4155129.1 glycosyltransferase [Carboxylicivirga sp. A043]